MSHSPFNFSGDWEYSVTGYLWNIWAEYVIWFHIHHDSGPIWAICLKNWNIEKQPLMWKRWVIDFLLHLSGVKPMYGTVDAYMLIQLRYLTKYQRTKPCCEAQWKTLWTIRHKCKYLVSNTFKNLVLDKINP